MPNSPQSICAHSPGCEVQLEEGRLVARPDAVHVVLDDGDAAVVAGLAQPLEDLLGAVRVGIEPAHDLALEGVELAGARCGLARSELLDLGPPGHRARVQAQRTRGLRHRELLAHQVVADAAVGLIVDHGAAAPAAAVVARLTRRRWCWLPVLAPLMRGARDVGRGAATVPGRASTWYSGER